MTYNEAFELKMKLSSYIDDNYENLHDFGDVNKVASALHKLTEGFKKFYKNENIEIAHIFLNDYDITATHEIAEFNIHTVDRNATVVSPTITTTKSFDIPGNHIIFLPEEKYCNFPKTVYCEAFDELDNAIEHNQNKIYTCQMGYLYNYRYLINSGYRVYIAIGIHRLGYLISRELRKEDFVNTNPFELWMTESLWED